MQVDIEIDSNRKSALSNGFAATDIVIPELGIRQRLFIPYEEFHRYGGARETIADDFLFVSTVCYSIDLLVARKLAEDNWTRELTVEIPVHNPELWNAQASLFIELLTFLTGDKWSISFSKRNVPLYIQRKVRRMRRRWAADCICLFSGGLDSLIGAIDHLSISTGHTALVGHYDLGLAGSIQSMLFDTIQAEFGIRRVHLFQGRIGFNRGAVSNRVASGSESTQRSRSLIFIALGVYIAHQQGKNKQAALLIPENGFISLNPPLTYSRLGSCSTRTVHPYYLSKLQELVDNLGLLTPISNPLADKTKGQALASSTRPDLIHTLAPHTVSCAHPTRRQFWNRRNVNHCGYCIPCLIRRAALHQVGLDDGSEYGIDIFAGELDIQAEVADDFRAVLSLIYNTRNDTNAIRSIVSRIPFSDSFHQQAIEVVAEQVKELGFLIDSKAAQEIRQWAGLQ